MEWWKTWELDSVVCWTVMREVNDKAILRAWVCGQCSEIGGDSCDRERERERVQKGEEKRRKANGRERERYVLREERQKLDKIILNFYHFLSVPFQRWNDIMSKSLGIWNTQYWKVFTWSCVLKGEIVTTLQVQLSIKVMVQLQVGIR